MCIPMGSWVHIHPFQAERCVHSSYQLTAALHSFFPFFFLGKLVKSYLCTNGAMLSFGGDWATSPVEENGFTPTIDYRQQNGRIFIGHRSLGATFSRWRKLDVAISSDGLSILCNETVTKNIIGRN